MENLNDRKTIIQACGYVYKDNMCGCGNKFNQLHSKYLMCPDCEDKKDKAIGLAKIYGEYW